MQFILWIPYQRIRAECEFGEILYNDLQNEVQGMQIRNRFFLSGRRGAAVVVAENP